MLAFSVAAATVAVAAVGGVVTKAGGTLAGAEAFPASSKTALAKAVGHAWALTSCCGKGWAAVACCSKLLRKACNCGLTPAVGQFAGTAALPDWMWLTKLATSWVNASTFTACWAWGERFTLLDSAACVAATICATGVVLAAAWVEATAATAAAGAAERVADVSAVAVGAELAGLWLGVLALFPAPAAAAVDAKLGPLAVDEASGVGGTVTGSGSAAEGGMAWVTRRL